MFWAIIKFIATYQVSIFSLHVNLFENISLLTGILYIVFAILENKLAWLFGFISSVILIFIYIYQATYFQSLLNLYYAAIAVYGYMLWALKDHEKKYVLKISEYQLKTHLILVFATLFIVAIVYVFFNKIFAIPVKQLDLLIFVLSILGTYMQVHKILSNWIYWIITNALTVVLCLQLQLYSIALLMLGYLIAAIIGYIRWKKIKS
ncbi:Nicotinamide riboside transporter PnuC [Candidatus Hepatincola sp. Pdp]